MQQVLLVSGRDPQIGSRHSSLSVPLLLYFCFILVFVSRLIFGNGCHSHGAPALGSIRQRLFYSLFSPLHPDYKGMGETKKKKKKKSRKPQCKKCK